MLSLKQEYESLLKEKEDEINSNKEKYDKLLKEKDEKLKGKDDQLKYLNVCLESYLLLPYDS